MKRIAILAVVTALGACESDVTSSDTSLRGEWGSTAAHLAIDASGALIQFRDGDCYGSFATSPAPIRLGDFTLSGVFTQLMGIAPGRIDYPAVLTGNATASRIVMTVNVPELGRTVGPMTLNYGTGRAVSACLCP
jgi:hypothetical protein